MFEHIIGYQELTTHLTNMLETRQLPQALMLEGEQYSGKNSIALEIARVLCCENGKSPNDCDCSSCRAHRHGQNYSVISLGRRCFYSEIKLCYDLAGKDNSLIPLLLRALRNLSCRFDPRIWDEEVSKVGSLLEELEDEMRLLSENKKPTQNLLSHVQKIVRCLPRELIPISAVRSAVTQAHYTASSRAQVFIIENADDLNISSANALLKIIEEPPPKVYFILTARYGHALVASLRSRLQFFRLIARSSEDETVLLRKVFKTEQSTFRELFYMHAFQISPRELGRTMSECLIGQGSYTEYRNCLEKMRSDNNNEFLLASLYELSESLRTLVRTASMTQLHMLNTCWQEVRVCLQRVLTMNIRPEHAVEALYAGLMRKRLVTQ